MDLPTGTLVLSTSMLISTTPREHVVANPPTNYFSVYDFEEKGSSNVFFSEVTFKNVDLNAVIGPMYWEYDMFNFVVKSFACGSTVTATNADFGTSYNDTVFTVTMSGLRTYCENDAPEAVIAALACASAAVNTEKQMCIQFPANNILTVMKTDMAFADITIRFRRLVDGQLLNFSSNSGTNNFTLPTTIETLPAWHIMFDIFPVTSTYKKRKFTLDRNVR
jgi:hypothetical protein